MLTARGGLNKTLDWYLSKMVIWLIIGMEKKEAFNAFFASVFNNTYRPRAALFSQSEDHKCRNTNFPLEDTTIVRDQLYHP